MSTVPAARLRVLGDAPVDPNGDHVVYWMVTNRRLDGRDPNYRVLFH